MGLKIASKLVKVENNEQKLINLTINLSRMHLNSNLIWPEADKFNLSGLKNKSSFASLQRCKITVNNPTLKNYNFCFVYGLPSLLLRN